MAVTSDAVIRHLRRAVTRSDEAVATDAQLLTGFLDGHDETAFEALVRRHGPMVYGVCRRVARSHHDAEDAFQATFLILARKAAAVQPRSMVANWLHGVALRVAMKTKSATDKRQARERLVPPRPDPEPDAWSDLQPILDRELTALPEIYRLPIVLCDLEGKSIKEATRQLNWPQGTLAGRLARGRKLLARRLANRGVTLSAGTLTLMFAQHAMAAAPIAVVNQTLSHAHRVATGQAIAGVVPAQVVHLMEGALRTMLLTKLKSALGATMLVAVLIGTAAAMVPAAGGETFKATRPEKAGGSEGGPRTHARKAVSEDCHIVALDLKQLGPDRAVETKTCPKVATGDGELFQLSISNAPENLLDRVLEDEKIKIGTIVEGRVKRLRGNKVRLTVTVQKHDLEKSNVNEIQVLGHSVQAVMDVELRKPVKLVYEKDAKGEPKSWAEVTIDQADDEGSKILPPASSKGVRK